LAAIVFCVTVPLIQASPDVFASFCFAGNQQRLLFH
jgi:hypothetical protein